MEWYCLDKVKLQFLTHTQTIISIDLHSTEMSEIAQNYISGTDRSEQIADTDQTSQLLISLIRVGIVFKFLLRLLGAL